MYVIRSHVGCHESPSTTHANLLQSIEHSGPPIVVQRIGRLSHGKPFRSREPRLGI